MASINLESVSLGMPIQRAHIGIRNKVRQIFLPEMRTILSDLNFRLVDGDRCAILGSNGAGKTSLLRLVNEIYYPTTGSLEVNGKISSLLSLNSGLNQNASGWKNLEMLALLNEASKVERREIVQLAGDFTELGDRLNDPIHSYSSGMLVRLGFSIMMFLSPDIVLMDEWLSVGDKGFVEKAKNKLSDYLESSSILMLATHSRDLAESTCNKGMVMEAGKIAYFGPIQEATSFYWERT